MKTTAAAVLAFILAAYAIWSVNDKRIDEAYEQGVQAGKLQAPVQDINKQCVQWFFETNLRQAKKQICGGKK